MEPAWPLAKKANHSYQHSATEILRWDDFTFPTKALTQAKTILLATQAIFSLLTGISEVSKEVAL